MTDLHFVLFIWCGVHKTSYYNKSITFYNKETDKCPLALPLSISHRYKEWKAQMCNRKHTFSSFGRRGVGKSWGFKPTVSEYQG